MVDLKIAFAIILTVCYLTPAASGLTHVNVLLYYHFSLSVGILFFDEGKSLPPGLNPQAVFATPPSPSGQAP